MRIDGIDYNVALCKKMGKKQFIKKMAVLVPHLNKDAQNVYLSEVYELLKGG